MDLTTRLETMFFKKKIFFFWKKSFFKQWDIRYTVKSNCWLLTSFWKAFFLPKWQNLKFDYLNEKEVFAKNDFFSLTLCSQTCLKKNIFFSETITSSSRAPQSVFRTKGFVKQQKCTKVFTICNFNKLSKKNFFFLNQYFDKNYT